MIVSLAIGIGCDSNMKDEKKKIEALFYKFKINPNSTLTSIDFINLKDQLVSKEEMNDHYDSLEFRHVQNW